MKRFYSCGVLVLFLGTGCAVHRADPAPSPLVDAPADYSVQAAEPAEAASSWWLEFSEPQLEQLISEALADNFDLRQAAARLMQARAEKRQARSLRLPQLGIGAGVSQEWNREGEYDSTNSIGGLLSWELDLFGRIRSQVAGRDFLAVAAEEDIEALRLALSRAVAEAYFDVVEQREQLKLLRQQVKNDKALLNLITQRFDHGLAAKIDVLQQTSQVKEAEALIPVAEAELGVAENTLDVLLGQVPDGLERVSPEAGFPSTEISLDTGIPSRLLLRRPDLRRLQAQVAAADADIGRAAAERLPNINLTGSALWAAGTGAPGAASNILLDLVQPVIDWGRREAEVRKTEAVFEEQLLAFTQAYIEAVAQVENGLTRLQRQNEYLALLDERVEILDDTLDEARKRYSAGLTDYLPVLGAAQELRRVERERLRQKRQRIAIQTSLLTALGGGKLPPLGQ